MRTCQYQKIDAFTSGVSAGNPAACLYLKPGQALSENDMLAVAQQHKGFVSEVVYCEESLTADLKLTYYSSECEVDFCGHGTIACLYSLAKSDAHLAAKKEIKVETNRKGILTVYNRLDEQDAVFITSPQAEHIRTALTSTDAAAALGLSPSGISDKYPIGIINAGLSTLIIPMARLQDTIHVFPDEAQLKSFCETQNIGIILIFCLETADAACHAHTRVFAPRFGYLEDPATGSGNSAFGYYMLKHGSWDSNAIRIEQGGADRVFNTVHLTAPDHRVQFGGSATVRIRGEYYL